VRCSGLVWRGVKMGFTGLSFDPRFVDRLGVAGVEGGFSRRAPGEQRRWLAARRSGGCAGMTGLTPATRPAAQQNPSGVLATHFAASRPTFHRTLAGNKADSARWPCSPAWLSIELRRIAPQLGILGIISKVSGCDQGRVDIEPLPRTMPTRRNPMADDEMGPTCATLRLPGDVEMSTLSAHEATRRMSTCRHFRPQTRVCAVCPRWSPFSLPSTEHRPRTTEHGNTWRERTPSPDRD
jgi:hypothetical protein